MENGCAVFEVGSGVYRFSAAKPQAEKEEGIVLK